MWPCSYLRDERREACRHDALEACRCDADLRSEQTHADGLHTSEKRGGRHAADVI